MKKIFLLFCAGLVLPCFAVDRISVSKISASSTLASQGRVHYDAENLLDNDYRSVWATNFKGKTETLEFETDAYEVAALYIENGYWASLKQMKNNSSAKKMNIYVNTMSNLVMSVDLENPLGHFYTNDDYMNLEKRAKRKNLSIEKWDSYPGRLIRFPKTQYGVKKIFVEIEAVHEGEKDKDLCISTLFFIGEMKNPLKENLIVNGESVTIGKTTWMLHDLQGDGSEKGFKREEAVKACPAGWRLPTNKEWNDLVKFAAGKVEWLTDDSEFNFLWHYSADDLAQESDFDPSPTLLGYVENRLHFGMAFDYDMPYDGAAAETVLSHFSAIYWTLDSVPLYDPYMKKNVNQNFVLFTKYEKSCCEVLETVAGYIREGGRASVRCVKK